MRERLIDHRGLLLATLNSRNEQLAIETKSCIARVTPLLWHSLGTFPSGTSHTPDHTIKVEMIAGMILTPELLSQLEDPELQMLILACHFHDLGMAGTEFDNCSQENQEQARRDHAIRVGEIIGGNWKEFGFPDERFSSVLSEICRGHRPAKVDGEASWNDLNDCEILGPGKTIRTRLVAALIYAADELHIGDDRASKREEDFLRIANDESRRHWRRHQEISGPVVQGEHLFFQCFPRTPEAERDLREAVLRKALGAVSAANRQLEREKIDGALREIRIQWRRIDYWKLLLLKSHSDQIPRSRDELQLEIGKRFEGEILEEEHSLPPGTEDELGEQAKTDEIRRVIDQWVTSNYLIPLEADSSKLLLNPALHVGERIFELTRKADETDQLFGSRFTANHEIDLLRSEYGREFAKLSVFPRIHASFGVNLASEKHDSPLSVLIKNSPSAVKMLLVFTPAPSFQVKRHILKSFLLGGAILDVQLCPELMLDREFRTAVKAISVEVQREQGGFFAFSEELALLSGLSLPEVHEVLGPSSEELGRLVQLSSGGSRFDEAGSIKITQTIPLRIPAHQVSLGHLWIAALRTGVNIELLNAEEAPILVEMPVSAGDGGLQNQPIHSIQIGPSAPTIPNTISLRAQFAFDEEEKVGEFTVHEKDSLNYCDLPVVLSFPLSDIRSGKSEAQLGFGFYLPAFTSSLISTIQQFNRSEGDVAFANLKGRSEAMKHRLATEERERLFSSLVNSELVDFLDDIGGDYPVPWFVKDEDTECVRSGTREERKRLLLRYKEMSLTEKVRIPAITLSIEDGSGNAITFEFLGFFPHVEFNAPIVSNSSTDASVQDRVNDAWENPTEPCWITVPSPFSPFELARQMDEWAKDPGLPLTIFEATSDSPKPTLSSVVKMTVFPDVDRLWYAERKIAFVIRPPSRVERWQFEQAYWESKGDDARVELLRERLAAYEMGDTQTENNIAGKCEEKPPID